MSGISDSGTFFDPLAVIDGVYMAMVKCQTVRVMSWEDGNEVPLRIHLNRVSTRTRGPALGDRSDITQTRPPLRLGFGRRQGRPAASRRRHGRNARAASTRTPSQDPPRCVRRMHDPLAGR